MATALSSPPALPPRLLDDTLGAAYLGHFVTTLLYGITSLQAFIYYRNRHNDSNLLKFSVFGVWILDTIHVSMIAAAMYWYCVTSFTKVENLLKPVWPIPTMIIVSNLSNATVRGFFGYRLYKLCKQRWILPAVIFLLSVFIFVDGIYFAVKLYEIPSYNDVSKFSWGLYSGLSVEAAVDLIIAIAQCVLLRELETGIRSTDTMIHVLMTYSVNTGLLTSLCAIGALVSYAAAPRKFIYFAFYFILSKLYVNSLLATLNARGSLLSKTTRRRRHNKVAFRGTDLCPTSNNANANNTYDRSHNAAIEFTTVISAGAISSDSVVETSKTKIDEEAAYPLRS